ncbi:MULTISPECIES: sigma-54-dependent Fis family transcriptional regulator [Carboxydocella]|uniref:Regulatory protein, Fis family n=2 Tax=Carboxydocella TaxID=178898 RepID=A0A1T4LUR7_9FIRM|nr:MULTISPECIES: sigma-54 dependent transcriptional regulator [Carboxydocella]AVX20620.1 regulatory protein, Fis family [Carboxydocella thermautotrophica]GAW27942.1 sigma-54-dependent Fis family transcriptional regulator [Carboxydocella sp. ULO1]GAW31548.1 sigma-54-dependent Fis family transcriptional regulator [Carboxydocella sp. JDF658]SJZ58397.1 regulatory protein, Fis family [Carboxydocella sporoproducens DSM 16521]
MYCFLDPSRENHSQNLGHFSLSDLVGISPQMVDIKETIIKIAPRKANVLILGESGTGKELVAQAIHYLSNRRFGPLIKVNCAAIPESLFEAELFGYEEGAFTGAKKNGYPGKFLLSHQGTFFLDEIGELPLPLQAKLLRVLQEKTIEPLGSTKSISIDTRIIAATNANLSDLVKYGKFRADLYYRLNVVAIHLPALRERKEDLPLLINYFIKKFNREYGMQIKGITKEVLDIFMHYTWPGNIRELANVIETAFNFADGELITVNDLPQSLQWPSSQNPGSLRTLFGTASLNDILDNIEKNYIVYALQICQGNKVKTAELLGISRPCLYKKLIKYGLEK